MKKILFLLIALLSISALASCNHEHSYENWEITKEPTCTEKGEREGICSCGEKSTLYLMCVDHDLDDNYICRDCNVRTFNLTAAQKKTCEKVAMYSNAHVVHVIDEKTGEQTIDFQFTLNEASKNMLTVPAFIDIVIRDNSGENILLQRTYAVEEDDYSTVLFNNDTMKKIIATISIPTEDILKSAYDKGMLNFHIYHTGFFDFEGEETLTISSGLPECNHNFSSEDGLCTRQLQFDKGEGNGTLTTAVCGRECDHIYDSETDTCETCHMIDPDKITVNLVNSSLRPLTVNKNNPLEISFRDGEISGTLSIEIIALSKSGKNSFGIYIKAKIVTPDDGKNYTASLGYKLYDDEGVIVQSGVLSNEISKNEEYFIIRGSLTSLTPGGQYKLAILQR